MTHPTLTAAQIKALLWLPEDGMDRYLSVLFPHSPTTMEALEERGVVRQIGGLYSRSHRLTPAGIAARREVEGG